MVEPISVDISKITWKDGKLNIPVAGHNLKLEIIPNVSLYPKLFKDEVMFHADVTLGETEINVLENPIKTQKDVDSYLAKEPALPTHWKYEDMLLGFVYGNKDDPYNYNWFLQLRVQDKFRERLFSPTNVNIHCPLNTISWFEAGNWHGRFCFIEKDIVEIQRIGSDLNVVGKTCGGHKIDDLSLIPEGATRIVIRYDIKINKWFLHFQKDGEDIKVEEVDGILADIPMYGNVNRNYKKPRVTQYIKVDDIAHIKILSKMAIIYGK